MFVACATAYAFFQVPYVAMPAEITDSYDERTRLMTWRVAILALAIMLSGASAPAIRDAFEGRAGYRVMGVAIAVLLVDRRRRRVRRHPVARRSAGSPPAPGRCASSCASSPAPATSGCCSAPS